MNENKDRVILMVEDNEDDVFFLKLAFTDAGITNPIQVAEDGERAINYLAGQGPYADRKEFPMPALVLVDLKLPRRPGLEVIQWMRERKIIGLPVIVFTSSADANDIKAAYAAGASSFVVKPLSVQERRRFAILVKDYWLGCNIVPPQ